MTVVNLCSRWNQHLRTQTRCSSTMTSRRRYLRVRTQDHQQSRAMESCTLLFPLAFLILLPFPLLDTRTRLLPSRLPNSMMGFFPLLTSPPVFLSLFPSGARALFPRAWVCLNRFLLHLFLVRHPRSLGCIPFPFLPSPLPSFLHLLLIRLLSSRLPIPPPPLPSLLTLLASLHSLLLHLHQVAQCSVSCPFLHDIACHYVSLCRSLIFLSPPSFLFPSATGESP